MHQHNLQRCLAVVAFAVVLSACGSSGGDAPPTPPVAKTTDVPDSALGSVSGLIAYMASLIGMTSETSEPVLVGDVTLPTDNTAEPAPVP